MGTLRGRLARSYTRAFPWRHLEHPASELSSHKEFCYIRVASIFRLRTRATFVTRGAISPKGENTMLRKLLLAVSLFLIAGAPISAQAATRDGSPASANEKIAGVGTLGIVITLAVVVGVILIVSNDKKNKPASP